MHYRQGNLLESLRGIQAFLDEHADALGTIPKSGTRQKLDAQVAELMAHAVSQAGSHRAAKDATQRQHALRQTVRHDHMAPIARIAVADLPPGPGLTAFKLPRHNISTQSLHAAALGMADAAERQAAVFTTAGLSDDFATQLRHAVNGLLVQVDSRTRSRSVLSGATASLRDQSSNARKTVRVLDALVRRQLKGNAELLGQWSAVKRPPSKPGRSTTAPARAVANA